MSEDGKSEEATADAALLEFSGHANLGEWLSYLREHAPVHRTADGIYSITRYDDVAHALNDSETFSSRLPLAESDVEGANARLFVYEDGDAHSSLRRLVARGMTGRAVTEIEPALTRMVQEQLDAVDCGAATDMVPIARSIALNSLGLLMGMEADEVHRIEQWLRSTLIIPRPTIMAPDFDKMVRPYLPATRAGRQALFDLGVDDLRLYLSTKVEQYAEAEMSDIQPPFVQAVVRSVREDPANLDRIVAAVMPPTLAGGVHTMTNALVNMVHYVTEHPELLDDLREKRIDVSMAVEEILRVKGLIQGMPRVTTQDVVVRDTRIPAGSTVRLMYFSSSHDGEAFEHPDEFAPEGSSRHFALGFGRHHCSGASLARSELGIVLQGLVDRFSGIELLPASEEYGGLGVYQTLTKLMVLPKALREPVRSDGSGEGHL